MQQHVYEYATKIEIAGVVRLWRNDTTRTVTTYDAAGLQTSTRPYTSAENAAADMAAVEAAAAAARKADRLTVRAILDTINAEVIDAARLQKAAAQTILDATAPTNVAQAWVKIKDAARICRDTCDTVISAGRAAKALAKYTADL